MSDGTGPPGGGGTAAGAPPAAYVFVERRHLRQWIARAVLPLGIAAANGAALLDVSFLPRHDAPVAWLGWPGWTATAAPAGGVLLVALAAALRVGSKGVLVRKTEVTTGGVYRWSRHPFYLAVLFGGAGTLLLAGPLGALVAAAWLLPAVAVHLVTVRGEEAGLAALHGTSWSRYAARVPRLLPWRGPAGPRSEPPARVTWRNLLDEREPPRLLRFLGSAAIVHGVATPLPGGGALAGAGVLLHAVSHLLPGGRRARRA